MELQIGLDWKGPQRKGPHLAPSSLSWAELLTRMISISFSPPFSPVHNLPSIESVTEAQFLEGSL